MRDVLERLCSFIDKNGGPCIVSWLSNNLPVFERWFWRLNK